MTKWPELRIYMTELLERKMPDEVDYRALLRKYMLSVINDNRSVALRCAEDDDYTDQELMALAQIVRKDDPPAADYLESESTTRAKRAVERNRDLLNTRIIDGFEGYHRFVYRELTGGDISPPYGIWDNHTKAWADYVGSYPTQEEAMAHAAGMNRFRESVRSTERRLTYLRDDLERALATLESIIA